MSGQVLSSDEVDALLKATQDKECDLSKSLSTNASQSGANNAQALNHIVELTKVECEKILTSFFRRKITIKNKSFNLSQLSACLKQSSEKRIFSAVRLMPNNHYGMLALDITLLHHSINTLYGGQVDINDTVIENPGKVGLIIAEKISLLCFAGFVLACHEHGEITPEIIKTSTLPNLSTNFVMEDQVYSMEMVLCFDDIEAGFTLMVEENFLNEFLPAREGENHNHSKHREKDFWRTAIKTQVVDSHVTVNVALTDIHMKIQDFMTLKAGDLIPISDPTLVYICLNNLKLFRAQAGQSNSKRVAKILSQI